MKLREQTGLFYSISGSTIVNAGKQPWHDDGTNHGITGSLSRGTNSIVQLLDSVVDTITEQELQEAKTLWLMGSLDFLILMQNRSNILVLAKVGFLKIIVITEQKKLAAITLQEVKDAARRLLRSEICHLCALVD